MARPGTARHPIWYRSALELLATNAAVELAVFTVVIPSGYQANGIDPSDTHDHKHDQVRHELAEDPALPRFDEGHEARGYDHDPYDHNFGPNEDHPLTGFEHS